MLIAFGREHRADVNFAHNFEVRDELIGINFDEFLSDFSDKKLRQKPCHTT